MRGQNRGLTVTNQIFSYLSSISVMISLSFFPRVIWRSSRVASNLEWDFITASKDLANRLLSSSVILSLLSVLVIYSNQIETTLMQLLRQALTLSHMLPVYTLKVQTIVDFFKKDKYYRMQSAKL